MTPYVTMTYQNFRFENVSPLMSTQELGEFLNLNEAQLVNFRHRHKIRRVRGTHKYSTAEIIKVICGAPEHAEKACEDPGLAALKNM